MRVSISYNPDYRN